MKDVDKWLKSKIKSTRRGSFTGEDNSVATVRSELPFQMAPNVNATTVTMNSSGVNPIDFNRESE